MILVVLFLLIKACASFKTGPPYAMCDSFNTGHPDLVPSYSTVTISLLKGDQPVSCYQPAETYTMVFNASKKFTGILLQSNVGSLPAPNQGIPPSQNLALGPCETNTISHRLLLNANSIQVSYKAPDSGSVTFRYTVVFRYDESLVNRNTTFLQCPIATTFPPSKAFVGDIQSIDPPPILQTNATCNRTTILSFENQTYMAGGHTYKCMLAEPIKQASCERQCVRDGNTLCCTPDNDLATTPTKSFECREDGTSKMIFISRTVVRRMRCACTIASDGGVC